MEYENISSKFTLQTQRKTEYGGQCKREYAVINRINSLYLQWKGLRKIVFLYSMKDQCKEISHYIPGHSFRFPSYWSAVSCIYDILAAFRLSCTISHIQDTLKKTSRIYLHFYHFTLRHYLLYGKLWNVDLQAI